MRLNAIQWLLLRLLPRRRKDPRGAKERRRGAKKSHYDPRDYHSLPPPPISSLGVKQYNIPEVSKVEQQGLYNSCVSQAITTAVETMAKTEGWPHYLELSRMHLWNEARQRSWGDAWKANVGVYLRDGWKAAAKEGITIEKLFPYQQSYSTKDLHRSWAWRWYPPFSYHFISHDSHEAREESIKWTLLNLQVPIVFGIPIPDSFDHPHKSLVYNPPADEMRDGNHAMVIIGWDDDRDAFRIRNSWGKNWGDRGDLWVKKAWILGEAYDISYCEARG